MFLNYLKEELQFIFTNRKLLVLLFIAPIFLTLWFGGAYIKSYVDDVPIAVLDQDNTSLSRTLVSYFNDNEHFQVVYTAQNEAELKEAIEKNIVFAGIYIQPNFYENIKKGNQSKVLLLTNGTNTVIANNVYAGAVPIVQTVSAGASIQMIEAKGSLPKNEAKNIALAFQFTDRTLYDPTMTYMNYLILGFVAVFVQQINLSGMSLLIGRNTRDLAEEHTLIKIGAKFFAITFCLVTTFGFTLFLSYRLFSIPITGNIFLALLMAIVFALSLLCPAILFFALFKNEVKFAQFSFTLAMPIFLTSGYVWPISQMPLPLVTVVKIIWPFIYFARPFSDVLMKGATFSSVGGDIAKMILYTVIYLPISIFILKKVYIKERYTKENYIGQSI